MSNIKLWTTTLYLIFSFLCVLYCNNLTAQQEFNEADSLMEAGKYFPAAVAYEKVVFLNNGLQLQSQALYKKAFAYKALQQFNNAQRTLQRIDIYQLEDSFQYIIRYETILNAYLAENYEEAEAEIIQLEYFTEDQELIKNVLFLKILVLNELQRWEEAKGSFIKYIQLENIDIDPDKAFYFIERPKLRNPKRAALFSTFVPGSGQIYGGAIWSGLASFTIQSAFLAFGVYNIWNGYYLTGIFTGLAMLQAFYFGGIEHAAYITKKKNEEKIRKYNDSVKEIILSIEKNKVN